MRGGWKMRTAPFYARPSASQAGEKRAGGGGGSLFSLPACLCLLTPVAAGVVFLYLCVMLDYRWLFNIRARGKLLPFPRGRPPPR